MFVESAALHKLSSIFDKCSPSCCTHFSLSVCERYSSHFALSWSFYRLLPFFVLDMYCDVRAIGSYQYLWVKEFSVISKVLMRAATVSWMTSLSWILPLFLTLASEQELVYWFLDYWLHRWIGCWLLRSPGPTSFTAAERQHPHLGFNLFCAQKESDDCPPFLLMLCRILLVHPFFCPRCPPLFVHSLMSTDLTHTFTHTCTHWRTLAHVHARSLPVLCRAFRVANKVWPQCQKSSVRRSHFQVTRLNTINPLFVFSACSKSVFCFHQKDVIPIISSSAVCLGQCFSLLLLNVVQL